MSLNQARAEASTAEHQLLGHAKHVQSLISLRDSDVAQSILATALIDIPDFKEQINAAILRAEGRFIRTYRELQAANSILEDDRGD